MHKRQEMVVKDMDNTYVQLKIDTKIRSIKDARDMRKSVYTRLVRYI